MTYSWKELRRWPEIALETLEDVIRADKSLGREPGGIATILGSSD